MDERPRREVSFGPLHVPSAAGALAADLRERILAGDIPEGAELPSERELVAQTELSRVNVREALVILETQGMIEQRGTRGARVRRPGADTVAASIALAIRGAGLDAGQLLESRQVVESECAALAALHRDDDDLDRIRAAGRELEEVSRLGSGDDWLVASTAWHLAIAAATHNPVLLGALTAIAEAVNAATDDGGYADRHIMHDTFRVHEAIVEAIVDGDAVAARARMIQHVGSYVEQIDQLV